MPVERVQGLLFCILAISKDLYDYALDERQLMQCLKTLCFWSKNGDVCRM
jgi:hypothetical protein